MGAYIAIDLKSFYASVECIQRGLDPMTVNLVVADESRTEKTICLAVSPALKAFGIPGRPRLFEVVQQVEAINRQRQKTGGAFRGSSCCGPELAADHSLKVDYIVAKPQMALYMEVSTRIYQIYLRYIAPEDIHVYSIDEVFIDVSKYRNLYRLTPRQLALKMVAEVQAETGIAATVGVGTNLYLSKIAMDIGAKHARPDVSGIRIAELDELTYRQTMWDHLPLTDFWRVGRGTRDRLAAVGLYTMGDIACCSIGEKRDYYNADLLYRLFGVNAELLIDHAWGWESCTIADIKAYTPSSSSTGSGQVLQCAYPFQKAKLVAREMADALAMDLLSKKLVTDQVVLTVGYDVESLSSSEAARRYRGPITVDAYGRRVPKGVHSARRFPHPTASAQQIMQTVSDLFDQVVNPLLLVRRMSVVAGRVLSESAPENSRQLALFEDPPVPDLPQPQESPLLEKEKRLLQTSLLIRRKYGKNALVRGMNLQEGATAMERNQQIGGHKA